MVRIYLIEKKLTKKERENLPPDQYGWKDEEGVHYPLNDKGHVMMAIKLFKNAPENRRKELAKKILKQAKKYGIEVQDDLILKYV